MTTETIDSRPRGGSGGGSRAVLIIGLGLGVLTAVLIAVILAGKEGEKELVPATRVAVVARTDIPERTRITPDMLEVKAFRVEDVEPDAFATVSQVNNRVTAVSLKAGDVIVPASVSTTPGQGLSFTINRGMRAASIRVQEVVTAGGNISPGNHVDIIGTFHIAQGGDVSSIITQFTGQRSDTVLAPAGATLTFTILQDVRVLAVAQDLPTDANAPTANTTSNNGAALEARRANPKASTVTLEVTPQQAQVLAVADLQGDLRLSLRPFGEEGRAAVSPIVVLID